MPNPIQLPIAEYLPDVPDYPASGSENIRNVYPRTPASYGPILAPKALSSALTARCQGATGHLDKNGVVNLFAGDATKLYRILYGDAYVWKDVSHGVYHIDPTEQWEFVNFNGSIIAVNINDNIQTFNMTTDAVFSDLGFGNTPMPPRAKHVAVIKNSFVMLGNTTDPVDGRRQQRVWWSAAGDATNWPTPGGVDAAEVQSTFYDLLGDDGGIQAIRGGLLSADGLVFQQYGVRRAVYSGPPQIFEFLPAQNNRGTPASYSPVVKGGICYFLSWDGFYECDGAAVTPIGNNKVDRTFFDDIAGGGDYLSRVIGKDDPLNKMVWWIYPGAGSTGAVPNRMIGFNWDLRRWSIVDIDAEVLCNMISIGYTLDELWTILGYTLDGVNPLPASLDSPIWQGGQLSLGMFNTDHKLSYFTGPAMAATIETSDMQPVPGRRSLLTAARPLIDGSGIAAPSVAIGHRERLQNALSWQPFSALNQLGTCPGRTSGRYVRGSITVSAGGDWSHISGIELDAVPQGSR